MNRVLKILRILAGLVEIVLGLVVVLVAVMLFMLAEAFASTASSEHAAMTLQEATAGESTDQEEIQCGGVADQRSPRTSARVCKSR